MSTLKLKRRSDLKVRLSRSGVEAFLLWLCLATVMTALIIQTNVNDDIKERLYQLEYHQ